MTEEEKKLRKSLCQKARRKMLLSSCQDCGTNKTLEIHHINENWRDNSPENIRTLCKKCHMSQHIGERLPCRICGKEYIPGSSRKDLCNRHRLKQDRAKPSRKNPCSICGRITRLSRGMCSAHYERWRKNGNISENIPIGKMLSSH